MLILLVPLVYGFDTDIQAFSSEVEEFIAGDDALIVMGEYASKTERAALLVMQETNRYVNQTEVIPEQQYQEFNGTVILVGGPRQNDITASVLAEHNISRTENISIGVMTFIDQPKYIIISDKAGYENIARRGLEKSPYAKVMPEEYVPAAAALTGFGLMWLIKLILGLVHKIFRFGTSYTIMNYVRKKNPKERYAGINIMGIRLKLREWLAVISSAVVFALAFSWSFLAPGAFLSDILMINFIVNLIVYAVWVIARLIVDRFNDLHNEYVFWFWGGLITIISGWLGNAFCLAGYNVSHKETDHDIKVHYMIDLFSFLLALILIIVNIFYPSRILQLAGAYALVFVFLDMLPMKPFAGKAIYRWNKTAWYLTFIPMALLYIATNLVP